MGKVLRVSGIAVDVVLKEIKNVHLTVRPPTGRVRVAAPARMPLDTIRVFVISKLGWIRRQQERLRSQERESQREYVDRESHYVWGKRYLLKVIEHDGPPSVALTNSRLQLRVRPGTSAARREALLDAWYRGQIRQAVAPLLAKWEPALSVKVRRVFIQRMRTKWGSCGQLSGGIRLNSELAKKPKGCLEYIVVHEMVHLLEPTHNDRFQALMEQAIPKWPFYRKQLNAMPVRHEDWNY
jgi:predicted metal-dependent hydrolase